jgi:hypothetical protein
MNYFLTKFKNIDKFFRLFAGYDYDECCCGGCCSCYGGTHDNYTSLVVDRNIHLYNNYDSGECCCVNGHDDYISEENSSSFNVNFKRADVPLA